jgi:hypothetical protein
MSRSALSGQAARQRRGAADRGEYRKIARAAAQAVAAGANSGNASILIDPLECSWTSALRGVVRTK